MRQIIADLLSGGEQTENLNLIGKGQNIFIAIRVLSILSVIRRGETQGIEGKKGYNLELPVSVCTAELPRPLTQRIHITLDMWCIWDLSARTGFKVVILSQRKRPKQTVSKNTFIARDKKLPVEISGLRAIKRLNSFDESIKINSKGKRL